MFLSLGLHVHVGCWSHMRASPSHVNPEYLVASFPSAWYTMSRSLQGMKHTGLGENYTFGTTKSRGTCMLCICTRAVQHTPPSLLRLVPVPRSADCWMRLRADHLPARLAARCCCTSTAVRRQAEAPGCAVEDDAHAELLQLRRRHRRLGLQFLYNGLRCLAALAQVAHAPQRPLPHPGALVVNLQQLRRVMPLQHAVATAAAPTGAAGGRTWHCAKSRGTPSSRRTACCTGGEACSMLASTARRATPMKAL